MAKKDTPVRKVGGARSFLLTARSARSLVSTGRYEYVEEVIPASPAPPAPVPPASSPPPEDLDSLSYWQLRRKADEAGLDVNGRTKADYLAALRKVAE